MNQNKITSNLKKCPRFNECSANVCPLDSEAEFRKNLPNEKRCPYTIDRKDKTEKGIKTLIPTPLFNFIPIRNLKMLNNRNQKRWHEIKTDENINQKMDKGGQLPPVN